MKMLIHVVALVAALHIQTTSASGAETPRTNPASEKKEPKTQLEAFEANTGAVIIRSWTKVGIVHGDLGTKVTIEARELINAATGNKLHGIWIAVKGSDRSDREAGSYIDYDEIDSLIKGIDYISKIDRSVTKLDDFQADYSTRGDLRVSTFTSGIAAIKSAVLAGRIYTERAYLSLTGLTQLRTEIVAAKKQIDDVKK
jgi:hypothetical protein